MQQLHVKSIASLLALASASIVWAQSAPSGIQLEEVLVTAQKREETLQDAALSVAVISGDDLVQTGKSALRDALLGVPGVVMQKYPRGYQVAIRGLGNDLPPSSSDVTVSVNKDGFFDARQEASRVGFYDVQRIEVLRGPQGTLYGRNATGGVVNLIYNDPTASREAMGSVGFGNYSLLRTEGMFNAPVSESLALRAAFATVSHDGYISNGQDDNDANSARVKLLYTPNDKSSILLGTEYTRLGGNGPSSVPAFGDEQPFDPWQADASAPDDNYLAADDQKYYARLNADLDFGQLTVIPAYQSFHDQSQYWFSGRSQYTLDDHQQTSVEVRLASHADSLLRWVAGVFYYDSDNFIENLNSDEGPGSGLYTASRADALSYAAFANLGFSFGERWNLSLGGRVTEDEKESRGVDEPSATGDNPTGAFDWNRSWTHTDVKLTLEYEVTENSMAYLDYSTGYRPGGNAFGQTFEPETLKAYQFGSKNRILDGSGQVNLSAFYYDYTDYQAIDVVFDPVTSIPDPTTHNGDARLYGADLEASFLLSADDRLDLTMAYLHSEFTDLVFEGGVNYNGEPLSHAPEWTLNLSYQHVFHLGNGATLTPKLESSYETENNLVFTAGNDPLAKEPAHTMSSVSLIYSAPDDRWSVSTYIRNIEDHAEKSGKFGPYNTIGTPRIWGATLSMRLL